MDIIDLAVIDYAKSMRVDFNAYKRISHTPFNPSIKRSEAIIEVDTKHFKAVKGAAQIVISMCRGIDKEDMEKANGIIEEFSRKGYRTIAVARSEGDDLDNLKLAGLLSLADPPRPDSKSMIEQARKLGIKPIMLTGDSMAIAKEIALQAGIGGNIIRMADIEGLSEDEQMKVVGESDGFAEIYPEDKYKDRETSAVQGSHGRDDRRRCQRCAGAETGGDGDSGEQCDRRGKGVCERGPDRTGYKRDNQCGNNKQTDLSADADMGH